MQKNYGPSFAYPSTGKTDDDTERQLVHTLAHAIVFIVSNRFVLSRTSGAEYISSFNFSNGPANQGQAGPSCDDWRPGGNIRPGPLPGRSKIQKILQILLEALKVIIVYKHFEGL